MSRRICYISGTRADFGLMRSTLQALHAAPGVELSILVTGMHLTEEFGLTVRDIEAAQLPIAARIPVTLVPATGSTTARSIATMLQGFVAALETVRPHLLLLLGDRGEMLAGAIAALHLGMPSVHLHGGERSGSVDESVRHAISKLAHYHLVATQASCERLIRMGESPHTIVVTGAPGLDGIEQLARFDRATLCADLQLDPARPLSLLAYHPVTQTSASAGRETEQILEALRARQLQVLALMPNSDAGNDVVRAALRRGCEHADMRLATHLSRERFVSWMAVSDLMIGNSSAGIIEAASFGTPVINVGSRQNLRERNGNVVDVEPDSGALTRAIDAVLRHGRYQPRNIYGDGRAGERIVEFLRSVQPDASVMMKSNGY